MTLYLTSDEKVLDESNTRTKFKNEILPDFFRNAPFNLKLEEIFQQKVMEAQINLARDYSAPLRAIKSY